MKNEWNRKRKINKRERVLRKGWEKVSEKLKKKTKLKNMRKWSEWKGKGLFKLNGKGRGYLKKGINAKFKK